MPEFKSKQYQRIADLAEKGDLSFIIEPFDWIVLDLLPDEGTTVGGFYQLGTTVKDLKDNNFKDADLTSDQISGRIRTLGAAGFARQVQMVGGRGKIAWQKTVKGKEVLATWQQQQQQKS